MADPCVEEECVEDKITNIYLTAERVNFYVDVGSVIEQDVEYAEEDTEVIDLITNLPVVTPGAVVALSTWDADLKVKNLPTDTVPLLHLTKNNGIDLADTLPNLKYRLDLSDMTAFPAGEYFYRLKLIEPDGDAVAFIKGTIKILGF
jgi:hypothetical protein